MFRRKSREWYTPEEVEFLLYQKELRLADLSLLLNEERGRVAELLTRIVGPVPTPQMPAATVAPVAEEPQWFWSKIQPEDEAREDVETMVREGSIDPREAEAILEGLGFANTDIEIHH